MEFYSFFLEKRIDQLTAHRRFFKRYGKEIIFHVFQVDHRNRRGGNGKFSGQRMAAGKSEKKVL